MLLGSDHILKLKRNEKNISWTDLKVLCPGNVPLSLEQQLLCDNLVGIEVFGNGKLEQIQVEQADLVSNLLNKIKYLI